MSMAKIRFSRRTIAIAVASAVAMGGLNVAAPGGTILATPTAVAQEANATDTLTVPLAPKVQGVAETDWFFLHSVDKANNNLPTGEVFALISSQESTDGKFTLKGLADHYNGAELIDHNGTDEDGGETNPFKSIELNDEGDLVFTMKDGITRILYGTDVTLKDNDGKEHTIRFHIVMTSGVKLDDVTIKRDPHGQAAGYIEDFGEDEQQGFKERYGIDVKNNIEHLQAIVDGKINDVSPETVEAAKETINAYNKANNTWGGFIPSFDDRIGTTKYGEGNTFPHIYFQGEGQPEGSKISSDTVDGITHGGPDISVPGQGEWNVHPDSGELYGQPGVNGYEITFEPEDRFTGTPTLPRLGVRDLANYNSLASVLTNTDVEGAKRAFYEDIPVEAERFFFYNNVEIPAQPPVDTDEDTPAEDLHVTNVEKDKDGNYVVTRNDGEFWVINLKDIRDKLAELDKKKTVSPEDLKKVQDDLDKVKKDVEDLRGKDEALQNEIDQLKKDVEGLDKRVTKLEERVTKLENSTIKEVVKNGDGTYTLIRVDGTKVPGNIDPRSGSVTDVKTDGKGNLVITIDGKDKTVPLNQVKVTEENKGTPDHTVTITTPDGKSVTFNVFDTYVTDIKWNEAEGVYEIYRSDVDGGKTVWKTIDLSDLRNRIDALEKKDSPSRDEYNSLVKEVRENRELIEKLKEQIKDQNAADQEKITSILEKITQIEKQLTDMQADLDDIKARLTKVEGRTDDITKCVAGAGMAGIPALLSVPLMVMTQLNIPGIKDLNTQIQKQIGIYNPELARAWERSGGVLQAGAVLAGLAGIIGGISYIAKQCDPMMKTPAGQDTDLGKLSSKLEKKDLGSSKKDNGKAKEGSSAKKNTEATQPDKQDAEAAEEADAENPAETATEPSEELVDAQ